MPKLLAVEINSKSSIWLYPWRSSACHLVAWLCWGQLLVGQQFVLKGTVNVCTFAFLNFSISVRSSFQGCRKHLINKREILHYIGSDHRIHFIEKKSTTIDTHKTDPLILPHPSSPRSNNLIECWKDL